MNGTLKKILIAIVLLTIQLYLGCATPPTVGSSGSTTAGSDFVPAVYVAPLHNPDPRYPQQSLFNRSYSDYRIPAFRSLSGLEACAGVSPWSYCGATYGYPPQYSASLTPLRDYLRREVVNPTLYPRYRRAGGFDDLRDETDSLGAGTSSAIVNQ